MEKDEGVGLGLALASGVMMLIGFIAFDSTDSEGTVINLGWIAGMFAALLTVFGLANTETNALSAAGLVVSAVAMLLMLAGSGVI